MPHNNRVSTSASLRTNDIWSKAIGHDPYAEQDAEMAPGGQGASRLDEDKAKTLMEIARSQNTEDRSGNNFVANMYRGLKSGKKRRADLQSDPSGLSEDVRKRLADNSSSSEEEFLEVEEKIPSQQVEVLEKKKPDRKKKSKRKKDYDSDSSSSSSDDSYERRKRRKRERRKKSSKKRSKSIRKRDHSDSDSESDSSKRRRHKRTHSRRKESK